MKKYAAFIASLLIASLLSATGAQALEGVGPVVDHEIVNGQLVEVGPPEKAGKEEADSTQAPKEDLRNGPRQRSLMRSVATMELYRLYNRNSGEHFYTGSSYERDFLRAKGWTYEGIAWQAPLEGHPVFRLYNPNSGEHFYTTSEHERDVVRSKGWHYEGIGWRASAPNGYPVYRVYNPYDRGPGAHHFTLNANESKMLTSLGWCYEGIAWYGAGSAEQSFQDQRVLNVPNYDQYSHGAPSGCEGVSLLQSLNYKGKVSGWGVRQFLDTIPKSPNNDPNNGFVGSPYSESRYVYSAIYPEPLAAWGRQYGDVQNISGSSMEALINEIRSGNPVVVWVTINFQPIRWGRWNFGVAANNNHAVTLDGFNLPSNQVHVSDPISGSYWMSMAKFESIYNARKFAVVIR